MSTEMIATKCSKCKRLKKPGRGKKIAWRNRASSWMVVNARAPDEEPPSEEIYGDASKPPKASGPAHSVNSGKIDDSRVTDDGDSDVGEDNDFNQDLSNVSDPPRTTDQRAEAPIEPASEQRAPSAGPSTDKDIAQGPQVEAERLAPQWQSPTAGRQPDLTQYAAPESAPTQPRAEPVWSSATSQTSPRPEPTGVRGHEAPHNANGDARSSPTRDSDTQRSTPVPARNANGKRPTAEANANENVDSSTPIKKEIKLEDEACVYHRSATGRGLRDLAEAKLRDQLKDIDMEERRLALDERRFQLEEQRLRLQRQLSQQLREPGSSMKPIEIEDDE